MWKNLHEDESAPNQIENKKTTEETTMTTQIIGYMADPTAEARAEQMQREREEKAAYFMRQKVLGVAMLLTGILAPLITTEGITVSLFLIPYGFAMLISKEKMMTED